MTPHEEKQILTLNDMLSKQVRIGLVETQHEKSGLIRQFCEDLIQLVPKISVVDEEGDPAEVPTIKIHSGLWYQAVPSGTEVAPFIEAPNVDRVCTIKKDLAEFIHKVISSVFS
jgi:hypothetical protein